MGFRSAWHRGSSTVTCIACGDTVARSEAREYDKYGDRWDRDGKSFEFLCKPCDQDCCHSPRDGLEDHLIEAADGADSPEAFMIRYLALADGAGARASDG